MNLLMCLSLPLALLVTVLWMVMSLYADYLAAQNYRARQQSGTTPQRSVVRGGTLPQWDDWQWYGVGAIVLLVSAAIGLINFWLLLIVSIIGLLVFGAMLVTNYQETERVVTEAAQLQESRQHYAPYTAVSSPPMPGISLYGIKGEYAGQTLALTSDNMIGRSHKCHIRLVEPHVSKRHARIIYSQGNWFIQDQNSRAGTFVDGLLVTAQQLRPKSKIRICNTEFEFNIG